MIDKRTPGRKKYVKTVRDRNTTADITEVGAAGDDDDEEGRSEESESEHEDEDGEGGVGQRTQLQKRRQTRSVYFTTETVKRIESKEDSFPNSHYFKVPVDSGKQEVINRRCFSTHGPHAQTLSTLWDVPVTCVSPERLFISVGLVKCDLWGNLDTPP